MRRATIVSVRGMIVLLLAAAALDVPLPRRSGDRIRIHLVDRSQSVQLKGPPESLKLSDADAIIAHDRDAKASGDTVTWASFGKSLAWESPAVDASGTDLSSALTSVLGRNPSEIILHSDGRGDPGDALFLCRQRGVPVHVIPLGPTSVRDVHFRRINAPAGVRAGESCSIDVSVESTYPTDCRVGIGNDVRPVSLEAGVPVLLQFPRTKPGPFSARIEVEDDCPQNNQADGDVFELSDQPRILALSKNLSLPGIALTLAERLPNPGAFDAVILDNVTLDKEEQSRLAAYVDGGGGLLLLGGPRSYALGNWQHTPLEQLSPLKTHPDLKVAAVFGIDSSGSMKADFDRATQALRDARNRFDADDDVVAMTFSDTAQIIDFDALRKVTPTGGTRIARAITEAIRHLGPRPAGRKVIVLVTDGESAAEETPQMIQDAINGLRDIGLFVITTRKDVPGADNQHIGNWGELQARLEDVTRDMQDLVRKDPGILELRPHPITSGVQPAVVNGPNRTTAKPDAQVLATVGQAPKQDPVLALRPFGRGRVVAFTIGYQAALDRLFRQALDAAVGDRADGLSLSVDPPRVIAQGVYPDAEFTTEGIPVVMRQVGTRRWEGRLPPDLAGTVVVRKGRSRAAATIACAPEFAALGVDRAALERIAKETGGRVLGSPAELDTLPRPRQTAPRSGRALFLIAALVLVFVELGASIYWKV